MFKLFSTDTIFVIALLLTKPVAFSLHYYTPIYKTVTSKTTAESSHHFLFVGPDFVLSNRQHYNLSSHEPSTGRRFFLGECVCVISFGLVPPALIPIMQSTTP